MSEPNNIITRQFLRAYYLQLLQIIIIPELICAKKMMQILFTLRKQEPKSIETYFFNS